MRRSSRRLPSGRKTATADSSMQRPKLNLGASWLAHVDLPQRIAVGWSGGADSTALLLALATRGHQVVAWHVDHGWHVGSAAVAEVLRARAAASGISSETPSVMRAAWASPSHSTMERSVAPPTVSSPSSLISSCS